MNTASGQALCGPCRDHTHRAKMFSQHEIIHMAQKTKEQLIKKVTISVVKYNRFTWLLEKAQQI
jgi:hypothetical protein